MKIYVDTDDDMRLARRIQRDTAERDRSIAGVLEQVSMWMEGLGWEVPLHARYGFDQLLRMPRCTTPQTSSTCIHKVYWFVTC
jgi:uridine kinase